MAQRTPLAVSSLNPDILRDASAVAPHASPRGVEDRPGVPLFAAVKRPPMRSSAFDAFDHEAAVAGLLAWGAAVPKEEHARKPARPRALSARPRALAASAIWTRPIAVDGPEMAHTLAHLQAPLA